MVRHDSIVTYFEDTAHEEIGCDRYIALELEDAFVGHSRGLCGALAVVTATRSLSSRMTNDIRAHVVVMRTPIRRSITPEDASVSRVWRRFEISCVQASSASEISSSGQSRTLLSKIAAAIRFCKLRIDGSKIVQQYEGRDGFARLREGTKEAIYGIAEAS